LNTHISMHDLAVPIKMRHRFLWRLADVIDWALNGTGILGLTITQFWFTAWVVGNILWVFDYGTLGGAVIFLGLVLQWAVPKIFYNRKDWRPLDGVYADRLPEMCSPAWELARAAAPQKKEV